MDEFKAKINDYMKNFIDKHNLFGDTYEKKYENYSESSHSWQATIFFYRSIGITYICNFYLSKSNDEIEVSYVSLTDKEVGILADSVST